jgi:hypothetical protein
MEPAREICNRILRNTDVRARSFTRRICGNTSVVTATCPASRSRLASGAIPPLVIAKPVIRARIADTYWQLFREMDEVGKDPLIDH